jgi:hypothetical protein
MKKKPSFDTAVSTGHPTLDRFLDRWLHRFLPDEEKKDPEKPPVRTAFNPVMFALKVLPWLTAIVFFISLRWDLSGSWHLPWRESPVVLDGLIRMLSVTGLVGFGTNYIAIKMLFHPRKRRPLLGQGLIPASKQKIARKLGESISKEIINSELILKQVKQEGLIRRHMQNFNQSMRDTLALPEFRDDLLRMLEHYLNRIVRTEEFRSSMHAMVKGFDIEGLGGLKGGLLKIYRFIGGDRAIADRILESLDSMTLSLDHHEKTLNEYLDRLPDWVESNEDFIEDVILNLILFLIERINIQNIITQNLEGFDELRLERLLLHSTSDQLDYIQYLGCLLGILGGLFIWLPLESFALFSLAGGGLFLIDALLIRIRGSGT